MMSLLYKKAKRLPEEKKTAEVKAMIETYNKKVNFVVLNCLGDIIKRYSLNTNYNLIIYLKNIKLLNSTFCVVTFVKIKYIIIPRKRDIYESRKNWKIYF